MWEVTAGGAEREVGSHGESEEARAAHVHESFLILSKEAQAGQLHRPHTHNNAAARAILCMDSLRLQFPQGVQASVVAALGLGSCASWALECGFSSHGTCAMVWFTELCSR